jgi:hypothetical protein
MQDVSAGISSSEGDGVGVKNADMAREKDATVFLLGTIYCGRYNDCQIKDFLPKSVISRKWRFHEEIEEERVLQFKQRGVNLQAAIRRLIVKSRRLKI